MDSLWDLMGNPLKYLPNIFRLSSPRKVWICNFFINFLFQFSSSTAAALSNSHKMPKKDQHTQHAVLGEKESKFNLFSAIFLDLRPFERGHGIAYNKNLLPQNTPFSRWASSAHRAHHGAPSSQILSGMERGRDEKQKKKQLWNCRTNSAFLDLHRILSRNICNITFLVDAGNC